MINVGALGYGTSAVAFLLLAVLLVASWQGRGAGVRLVIAAFTTAAWGALLAYHGASEGSSQLTIYLAETLRFGAWLLVLGGLVDRSGFPRTLARAAYFAWPASIVAAFAALRWQVELLPTIVFSSGTLLALLGLVLLEQIYRNSNTSGRWNLRYLYFGLGGIFVYDVFLYAQGLLLQGLLVEFWEARGFVYALAVPLIAIAARRNPNWSLQIFVSREVAFYSTSILVVGVYLLLMAAGGYVVRLIGGSWSAVIQIVFFCGAVALLGILVASSSLRRRLKVFLVKHFYKHKYEYRDEWLRFIDTLSHAEDGDVRVTAARAVAQIIQSPAAALYVAHEPGKPFELVAQWPEGWLPAEAGTLGEDAAIARFLEEREWVIDLQEYQEEPERYEHLELPAWLRARTDWRLIVPAMMSGRLFGFLLLRQPPQGFELTFEDRDLLKTVARHIATHVAQQESERRLAESRQFETYSRLTAFLMHDLKNAAAQLQLVVANAEKHKRNPAFVDDAIETIAGSATRISRLIEQLQRGEAPGALERVDIGTLLAGVVARLTGRDPKPRLATPQPGLLVRANLEKLTSAVEHAVRNAQDATPDQGTVEVAAERRDETVVIVIRDNGSGMSPEFVRDRLFRPFDSTKGSKGMGIGAYQVREVARELGGDVDVESSPGAGTTFTIVLPAAH